MWLPIAPAIFAVLFASTQACADPASDARGWLDRMSAALADRNYDVQFVHVVGGKAENMRLIHRVERGVIAERLVSLDGSGREFIRNARELICYLPDRRLVIVEQRSPESSLLSAIPAIDSEVAARYDMATAGTTRILGRSAQVIIVQPRDQYRYGYRLWLDQETSLPLKSQVNDREGRILEQVIFSELRTPDAIDAVLLKPGVNTEGYRLVRHDPVARSNEQSSAWALRETAPGFRVTVSRFQQFAGVASPVRHLVLSDGLVSVSVFIEAAPKPESNSTASAAGVTASNVGGEVLSRVGSALALATNTAGKRVTVVGEVPEATLRAIAASVSQQFDASGNAAMPEREPRALAVAPR